MAMAEEELWKVDVFSGACVLVSAAVS